MLFAEIVAEYESEERTEHGRSKFADTVINLKDSFAEKLYALRIAALPENTETND